MGSALFHGGTVLTVDTENRTFVGGWITARDGRISGVGPSATTPDPSGYDEVFDLTGHLVMPGLVNAHTHSVMVLLGTTILGWLGAWLVTGHFLRQTRPTDT